MSVGDHPAHMADPAKVNARKVINKIKKKATTTATLPSTIVVTATAHASRSAKAELPDAHLLTKTIRRVRQRNNPQLLTPSTLKELIIPESFQTTIDGKQFLFYDDSTNKNRFIMFTTEEDLKRLSACKIWLSDGTFSVVPTVFKQLYTIHGVLERDNETTLTREFKSVPLVYILSPKKDEKTYTKILKIIKNNEDIDFNPDLIITDFERAFINSAQTVFPSTRLHGCYSISLSAS